MRILLVEDDEGVADFLNSIITEIGHEVVLALNAKEGIAELMNSEFDLVLSDYHMPGENGLVVYDYIQKNILKKPKFVLMSGGLDISEKRCLPEGDPLFSFLQKGEPIYDSLMGELKTLSAKNASE